ncbi:MAG: M28 family peptidase [Myxococcota bacterium]
MTASVVASIVTSGCREREPPSSSPATVDHSLSPATAERSLSPVAPKYRALALSLRRDVVALATEIGGRDIEHREALEQAASYIEQRWRAQGYEVQSQPYTVGAVSVRNLEVERRGTEHPEQIVVVGAHYDSWAANPGANDNGSGVAAMLELSRTFAEVSCACTLRFVAFVNEEPPYFHTDAMGSLVYARRSKARGEDIIGMLSLETMGYYTSAPDSQHYPPVLALLYPSRGNFVAIVGNARSRPFVHRVVESFERHTSFPVESIAATDAVEGIGWSDHWSFYTQGYPAVMVTDTAPNRYVHYHTMEDTPDKLDYLSMAQVVAALREVVGELVR